MNVKSLSQFLSYITRTIASIKLLGQHLRTPLYKNAYYLIAKGVVTSILGFVFWVVAARMYSPTDVGLASAAISAIILLSSLSHLGIGFGLIRFIPGAGERSAPMINSSLTIVALASLVAGSIFLGGLDLWSPALSFVRDSPIYIAMFVLFTLVWVLFRLTDEIFIAKRAAQFAFIKDVIAGSLKIALLLLPVVFFGAISIFSSVGLAMAIGVLIALLWFLPSVYAGYFPVPALRRDIMKDIIYYSLGNYFALLLWGLPAMIYPLMVVNILSAESNAYFYIAWAIASVVFVVPSAISFSVFAEGSFNEELLLPNVRKSLKLAIFIIVPAILVLCMLSGKILLLFGKAYSQEGLAVLVVLAFSALPLTVNHLYLSVNRVRKSIRRVVLISAAVAVLCLGLSYPLMQWLGIIGIGIGFLVGQSLVAAEVILPLLRQNL